MDPYLLQINSQYKQREFTAEADAERLADVARLARDLTGRSRFRVGALRQLLELIGPSPARSATPQRDPAV